MSKINVGDLIWIIDSSRHSIIPARINEQIVSKTISGEKVYHNIQFPSGKSQKLENLTEEWFSDLSGVRDHLLERASHAIEKSVAKAKDVASKKFNLDLHEEVIDRNVDLSQELSDTGDMEESVKVSLDNGQIVNVKVPQEFLDENFSG